MHLQRNLLYYRLFNSHSIFLRLPGQTWNPFNDRSDTAVCLEKKITINIFLIKGKFVKT